MRRALFLSGVLFAGRALADDADALDAMLGRYAEPCVKVDSVRAVSRVIELMPEQFQFVRAFFMAIPPLSRTLPPGGRAYEAIAGDVTMIALADGDGASCARFQAPDWLKSVIDAVGRGEVGVKGEPL